MNGAYQGAKSPATFILDSLAAIDKTALVVNPTIVGHVLGAVNAIPVTKPAQGSSLKPGEALWINWDRSKIAAYPQVALDAFTPDRENEGRAGQRRSGPFCSTIPARMKPIIFNALYQWGKDYIIRVATPDEKFIGWSGVFHVTPLEEVPETETFTGSHTVAYLGTGQSDWPGCLNTMGQGANMPPVGFRAVGWENSNDDPLGPCWTYVGHVYRTIVDPSGIYQGTKVTKALLRFAVTQGAKQTLYVLRRDAPGDAFGVAATTVATIGAWEFGHTNEVDVTAVVQAWCTGQSPELRPHHQGRQRELRPQQRQGPLPHHAAGDRRHQDLYSSKTQGSALVGRSKRGSRASPSSRGTPDRRRRRRNRGSPTCRPRGPSRFCSPGPARRRPRGRRGRRIPRRRSGRSSGRGGGSRGRSGRCRRRRR